jgi:hypothetical protein
MESQDERSPPVTTSGDTENSTHFHTGEGRAALEDHLLALPKSKWQRLKLLNEGMWNGPQRENTEALRTQDNLHIYDAVVCQLELTDHQKEWGRSIYDDLPHGELGRPVKQYAFAVGVLVANHDYPREGKRYWPQENATDNDELFEQVGDDLDLSQRQQLSALMKVKSRTDL